MKLIRTQLALLVVLSSVIVLCAGTKDTKQQQHSNHDDDGNRILDDFSSNYNSSLGGIENNNNTINDESSTDISWPWNKSHHNHEDHSCFSHKNCQDCTTSSWDCHWCAHDNTCHARGSWSGCINGVTCDKPRPPHENTTCSSHETCSECALSSWECHWCAHDNACHLVGSMYGCVNGVDCYSNNRCQRSEPKYIDGNFSFYDVGFLPTIIIFVLGFTCCCCSTLVFCISSGVKGAFDRSAAMPNPSIHGVVPPYSSDLSVISTGTTQQVTTEERENNDDNNINSSSAELDPLLVQQQSNASQDCQQQQQYTAGRQEQTVKNDIVEEAALLESHMEDQEMQEGYRLMTSTLSAQSSSHTTAAARGASSSFIQSMYNVCRLCYILSLVAIAAIVVIAFRYFPQAPTYNLCNDNLAWKSIVTGITKFKTQADFQLLLSIKNTNHFEISVDMGSGDFKHNGVFVGSFDIPPTTAPAVSIIDVLVIAHFTPGAWETLSLSKEYYDGSLAFDVDARATCRTPFLLNYSFPLDFTLVHLLVNDPLLDDRQLCACPTWDDQKNKTMVIF